MLKKPRNYYLNFMEGILSAVIKILKQSRTPLRHKYYVDNLYVFRILEFITNFSNLSDSKLTL